MNQLSEKRFKLNDKGSFILEDGEPLKPLGNVVHKLNEQQELIEELQVSDEMGWKRAERFEKKCPKELQNKKMYIKRLEYKVQKFKEENEQLKNELRKEKSLREYSDSMYGADLIVNIRFSNGEWKADVSVIDDE